MPKTKGRAKRLLMSGEYFNVPTPYGVAYANLEVWLDVQVRVDQDCEDDRHGGPGEGGDDRDNLLRGRIKELAERLADIYQSAKKATATEERVAQIELFESLEGEWETVNEIPKETT